MTYIDFIPPTANYYVQQHRISLVLLPICTLCAPFSTTGKRLKHSSLVPSPACLHFYNLPTTYEQKSLPIWLGSTQVVVPCILGLVFSGRVTLASLAAKVGTTRGGCYKTQKYQPSTCTLYLILRTLSKVGNVLSVRCNVQRFALAEGGNARYYQSNSSTNEELYNVCRIHDSQFEASPRVRRCEEAIGRFRL
jgi:hypothetical protein